MVSRKIVLCLCLGLVMVSGCSRQQSDWQKTREANTTDAYESFLKKYPSGEFTAQAQARVKDLYEERDWEKARDADTPEAYQAFIKQYPEGKSAEEARIRVENFTLAQAPGSNSVPAAGVAAPGAAAENGDVASPNEDTPAPVAPRNPPAARVASAAPGAGTPAKAPTPAVKPAKPPVAMSAGARAGHGGFGIQLGAFKTDRSAADRHWARLQKDYPKVMAGLSSTVLPKQTSTGNWYRLQAVGLSEKQARSICESLKAQSQACVVVHTSSG